ncbi:hypothetical protein ZWY2020_032857 [Hordeum vulgare]|nr:hypothetical protein ZWY2020_032857 [Hordeum vulgare]
MAPSSGDNDGACEKALTKAASDGNLCRLECDLLVMLSSNMGVVTLLHIGVNFGRLGYAEQHTPKHRFAYFALACKEIEDGTDRLTRRLKQKSPAPTHLSIYSPEAVNLTLIGLPGRTKVAIEWQLENITQDKENMVRLHVEKTNCIILATSPANQDIATSDAIKLARGADSTGERSFGVLTKLDFMDKGTNALDVLEGRAYKLQHPWAGIVNRSQADINRNVNMIIARKKEQDFFDSSPQCAHLASNMGLEYLAKLFSQV